MCLKIKMTVKKIISSSLLLMFVGLLPAQHILEKANAFLNSLSDEIKAYLL